jgi:hypothetical protein
MVEIRELSTRDTEELAFFFSSQTETPQQVLRDRLAWLARNPASTEKIPFGIAATQSGQICGAMLYVPVPFTDGREVRTCVLSILFYVDSAVRGAGLPLFLAFRRLADRYPLYASTANQQSARLWASFGASAVRCC